MNARFERSQITPSILPSERLSFWRYTIAFVVSFHLSLPSFANAAQGSVTRYQDWEVICSSDGKENLTGVFPSDTNVEPKSKTTPTLQSSCKATQVLAAKDTGQTVFALTILPASQNGQFVAVVSAPLGGYLVPGLEMAIDKRKPYKILFETCNAVGCHAGFELKGRINSDLSIGKIARFKLWTTKSRPAEVNISLAGFVQALSILNAPRQ